MNPTLQTLFGVTPTDSTGAPLPESPMKPLLERVAVPLMWFLIGYGVCKFRNRSKS